MSQTSRIMRLEIKFECFRDSDIFSSSHNSIQLLSQIPSSEHDEFRSFIKTVGMSQKYSFATKGEYSVENGSAELTYTEDTSIGLGGDTVRIRFTDTPEGRQSLMLEREPNPMKLLFSKGVTLNCLSLIGIQTEISTVTKCLKNTITESGGRLLLDYEMVLFGMSLYRSRHEIYALPSLSSAKASQTDETSPQPTLFYNAGKSGI